MTRHLPCFLLLLSGVAVGGTGPVNIHPATLEVDAAAEFTRFFDDTLGLPMVERVAAFHRRVAVKFPAFFDPVRHAMGGGAAGQDARIAAAISRFPVFRDRYARKVAGFDASLARNLASFRQAFPDFVPSTPIALVHSLGEMDGGTRVLRAADGTPTTWLIFGADVMAQVHDFGDESAFFHHELFHAYHHAADGCAKVICALWQEGLAVYVASVLHPDAGLPELLLSEPAGMVASVESKLRQSFKQLSDVLDASDEVPMAALFMSGNDQSGLPARRGYYLGLLLARELGRSHALAELAKMTMREADPLLRAAIARHIRN
jgi:hypothetical protein